MRVFFTEYVLIFVVQKYVKLLLRATIVDVQKTGTNFPETVCTRTAALELVSSLPEPWG